MIYQKLFFSFSYFFICVVIEVLFICARREFRISVTDSLRQELVIIVHKAVTKRESIIGSSTNLNMNNYEIDLETRFDYKTILNNFHENHHFMKLSKSFDFTSKSLIFIVISNRLAVIPQTLEISRYDWSGYPVLNPIEILQ